MIKFFWYLFSFLTILLITINSSSLNSSNNFISQNKILNFRSDQLLLQKLIAFCSFIFFCLTIFCLFYSL